MIKVYGIEELDQPCNGGRVEEGMITTSLEGEELAIVLISSLSAYNNEVDSLKVQTCAVAKIWGYLEELGRRKNIRLTGLLQDLLPVYREEASDAYDVMGIKKNIVYSYSKKRRLAQRRVKKDRSVVGQKKSTSKN